MLVASEKTVQDNVQMKASSQTKEESTDNSLASDQKADTIADNNNQNVSAARSQYATTEELLESQHRTKELQ